MIVKMSTVLLLALGVSVPFSAALAANPAPEEVYEILQNSDELDALRGQAGSQSPNVDCMPFVVRTYHQVSGALTAVSQCFNAYPDDGPSQVGEIVVHGFFYGNDQLVIENVE